MNQIVLCNHLFFYYITYKAKLRRVHYKDENGVLSIEAPIHINERKIIKLIKDDEKRIYDFMNKEKPKKLELYDGCTLKVLEKEYIVILYKKSMIQDNYICLKEFSIKELIKVVKPLLLDYLKSSQSVFHSLMYPNGNEPTIKIKNVKTYYGQYNYKYNNVTYNVGLAFVSKRCIDYVIVHELSHIVAMGHNNKFYKQMEKYNIDYKDDKLSLKKEWKILC